MRIFVKRKFDVIAPQQFGLGDCAVAGFFPFFNFFSNSFGNIKRKIILNKDLQTKQNQKPKTNL